MTLSDIGRTVKEPLFAAATATGLSRVVADSEWRRNRLLILCYHSISIRDEHLWRPQLFMSPDHFLRRMQVLREGSYNVIPLDEAVDMAQEGRLPKRAVVLTFDDGTTDFADTVWPILKHYGFPATVYLTTYYAEHRYPIFNLAIGYALWKAEANQPLPDTRGLNGAEKDRLGKDFARGIEFDWSCLYASRQFQIMDPEQVRFIAKEGCSVQLHTHRHRSPNNAGEYTDEIRENRSRIQAWTDQEPTHFCYPSGEYRPEFARWLAAERVDTAVTTQPGIVVPTADAYTLRRFVDTMAVSEPKFEAWLDGTAALLPLR